MNSENNKETLIKHTIDAIQRATGTWMKTKAQEERVKVSVKIHKSLIEAHGGGSHTSDDRPQLTASRFPVQPADLYCFLTLPDFLSQISFVLDFAHSLPFSFSSTILSFYSSLIKPSQLKFLFHVQLCIYDISIENERCFADALLINEKRIHVASYVRVKTNFMIERPPEAKDRESRDKEEERVGEMIRRLKVSEHTQLNCFNALVESQSSRQTNRGSQQDEVLLLDTHNTTTITATPSSMLVNTKDQIHSLSLDQYLQFSVEHFLQIFPPSVLFHSPCSFPSSFSYYVNSSSFQSDCAKARVCHQLFHKQMAELPIEPDRPIADTRDLTTKWERFPSQRSEDSIEFEEFNRVE